MKYHVGRPLANSWKKTLAKNLALLYPAKRLLDNDYLKTIYPSYTHSYLNYANSAWKETYFTKSRAIHHQ